MSTVLVVPDVHVPYHDSTAWNVCLKVIGDIKPDLTVVIGDFCDFYSVSQYRKDPARKNDLLYEVDKVNWELDRLAQITKDVVFIEGNHEDRLRRYLHEKAPPMFRVTDVAQLFKLDEREWRHVPYGDYFKRGKVLYVHDLGKSGKYSMYHTLSIAGGNVVFGHTHRAGIIYEGHIGGGGNFCLNVGWLGDYKALEYKHKFSAEKESRLGFGIVEEVGSLAFAQFVPIVRGKCLVRGKVY